MMHGQAHHVAASMTGRYHVKFVAATSRGGGLTGQGPWWAAAGSSGRNGDARAAAARRQVRLACVTAG
jgi:hypothetical protein